MCTESHVYRAECRCDKRSVLSAHWVSAFRVRVNLLKTRSLKIGHSNAAIIGVPMSQAPDAGSLSVSASIPASVASSQATFRQGSDRQYFLQYIEIAEDGNCTRLSERACNA
jgi:hypothetical protein